MFFILNKILEKFLQRYNSPFKIRLKQRYYNTKLGKFNLKIHLIWESIEKKNWQIYLFTFYITLEIALYSIAFIL